MCDEYNGWPNYQTWNCALWIDNDQGLQELVNSTVRHMRPYDAERWLKELIEENNPVADRNDMYSDIMGFALANIDYRNIIEHYQDEDEGEDEED